MNSVCRRSLQFWDWECGLKIEAFDFSGWMFMCNLLNLNYLR